MLDKQLQRIGDKDTCPIAVLVNSNNEVLIGLRHYTPDKWKDISVWTCPGGRCDEGETIEKTLRREIEEEVGITELIIDEYLGDIAGAKEGDVVPMFLCRTMEEPKLMEPHKFSEWSWKNPDLIPENFINELAREVIQKVMKL